MYIWLMDPHLEPGSMNGISLMTSAQIMAAP
jgi:hypothetical protein